MTTFVVANLGDAAFNLPTGTINAGGTVTTEGATFVNNTTGGPITVTMATGLSLTVIKDIAGNAAAHPITVSCSSGIDGGTTVPIAVDYAWVWLIWNGSSYSVVG